jgi:glycosyltransferase involved in cell wall biosynthesis
MTVGGAQTLLIDLLPELARDFEIELACLYPGILREQIEDQGIRVHELNHKHLFSPATLWQLRSIMKSFRPHVVHTHLGRADLYGRTAARMLGVPVVITHSHNIDDWKKRPFFNALDNFTLRWAWREIAVSDEVRRFLIDRNVPEEKVLLCYNGVNIERKLTLPPDYDCTAWRRQLGIDPNDKVLTVIGRIDEQKGHRFLIPAFDRFVQNHPEWRLLIVGGEGRINAEIDRIADHARSRDRIIFAGHRGDIPQVLASTDVFILSSLWEGHPMTLMEAMLWARPIVVTRVGGIPEVIDHLNNGYLIDPGKEDEIITALEWIDAHPDEATAMGARAKESAMQQCDVRNTARFLRDLYREGLREARSKRKS